MLCVSAATLVAGIHGEAHGAALQDNFSLRRSGQTVRFSLAKDEIHLVDQRRVGASRTIALQADAEAVRAEADRIAALTGGRADLVIYPEGAPRTQFSRHVVTRTALARLTPGTDPAAVATRIGASSTESVAYAPGFHLFTGAQVGAALELSDALASQPGVLAVEPLLATWKQPLLIPNDPLFTNQWHLLNTGQSNAAFGVDINVTDLWDSYTGQGVTISVVDTGVQTAHPDLLVNANTIIDFDYNFFDSDPSPGNGVTDAHGTAVAGVASGVGNNGIGITGVAFNSEMVGLRFLSGFTSDSTTASVLLHSNQVVEVSNNSWGPVSFGIFLGTTGPLTDAALLEGVTNGRNGLGNIFVFAAGNGDLDMENVNYNGYANSIYTVAVGALDNRGGKADYSNRGAALVVSAPSGGEISLSGLTHATTTTDTVGTAGFNDGAGGDLLDADYTEGFNGTSSAAPVVSGVVALMLEANPNLGWRDVQEILMSTAAQNDRFDRGWTNNAAGFHFHDSYGAGMVDAGAAVAMAQTWTNLPEHLVVSAVQTNLNLAIPDLAATGVSVNFDVQAQDFRVEHVTLTIDTTHSSAGDLEIDLISPSGMVSRLAETDFTPFFDYNGWKLMTVRNWGELAAGTWSLRVADRGFGGVGTLDYAKLDVWGTSTNVVPDIAITDAAVQEGDSGTTNAVFTVTLSQPVSQFISVSYSTAGGNANPVVDYRPAAGTLVFVPGETSKSILVPVNGDELEEQNETFLVSIFNATDAQIIDDTGVGEILNDDGPVWSVTDVSVTEADAGGTNSVVFDLSISEVSTNTVSVFFYTSDETALAGLDYLPTNGVATLNPGQTNLTVQVDILGDNLLEADETFALFLTNAVFSSVLDGHGVGTILDDEPRLAIEPLQLLEGNSGLRDVVVDVKLTKAGASDITVEYATTNLTAKADGLTGDYVAKSGTLTFRPGVTNQIITLQINGDTLYENDETFGIRLFNATNAIILTDLTTVTIRNTVGDDPKPQLSVVSGGVTEGDTGTTQLPMTVQLNTPSGLPVVVNYLTGVATASVGRDYRANSGTLIFQAGDTMRTVNIDVIGDTTHEQDETFEFRLRNEIGATILQGVGVGTITDNDSAPTISIADAQVTEGDSGQATAMVTVNLSQVSGLAISADVAAADGTATTADGDYETVPATVTIPAGAQSAVIAIPINGDADPEADEVFTVTLSNPTFAVAGDMTADVTIVNDDGPIISITDATVTEGNTGSVMGQVTVNLSEAGMSQVSVNFATADGSATAPTDYVALVGPATLVFNPGETSKIISFQVNGDSDAESDETFEIVLASPVNATMSDSRGLVTIADDDTLVDLGVEVVADKEPAFQLHELTYSIAVTNHGAMFGAENVIVATQLAPTVEFVSATVPVASDDMAGMLTFQMGDVAASAENSDLQIVVRPTTLDAVDFTVMVSSDQPESDVANDTAMVNTTVDEPMVVVDNAKYSFQLVSESFAPANGSLDPGETVTLSLELQNTGTVRGTNIVATLVASSDVLPAGGAQSQSYGALADGAKAARDFTFTVDAAATGMVQINVSLADDAGAVTHDLGMATGTFALPAAQTPVVGAAVVIPDSGAASVSEVEITGLTDLVVNRIQVTLNDVNHTFPADLDILLVGPNGTGVVLMSDAGRGIDLVDVDLTFSDQAAEGLPRLEGIASGAYQPTDHVESETDTYPGAPAGPYATALSAFKGANPNGFWRLYVVDDATSDSGAITGGWSLSIDTVSPVGSSAGLSVSVTPAESALVLGNLQSYTVTVRNDGPSTASNVTLTGDIATGVELTPVMTTDVTFIPSVMHQPAINSAGDPFSVSLGSLVSGGSAEVTVRVQVNSIGALTNTFSVSADELDLNPADNTISAVIVARRTAVTKAVDSNPSDGFQIVMQTPDDGVYLIEASSDLIHWSPVGSVQAVNGELSFNDDRAGQAWQRFYRVVRR